MIAWILTALGFCSAGCIFGFWLGRTQFLHSYNDRLAEFALKYEALSKSYEQNRLELDQLMAENSDRQATLLRLLMQIHPISKNQQS